MTISIKNLDAALGAEVAGIDLSKPVVQTTSRQLRMCGATGWSSSSMSKNSRIRN